MIFQIGKTSYFRLIFLCLHPDSNQSIKCFDEKKNNNPGSVSVRPVINPPNISVGTEFNHLIGSRSFSLPTPTHPYLHLPVHLVCITRVFHKNRQTYGSR